MSTPRRLVVMRHAKAEPYAATDFERGLTERGRADAEDAGRFLAGAGLIPDVVLVSSAVRALDTWAAVADALLDVGQAEPRVAVSEAMYGAGADEVLEALRQVEELVDEEVSTLLFVGHNPTAGMVATMLDDGGGDSAATSRMYEGFPTAAVAVFELPAGWSELGEGGARVVGFHVGRG